jgi:polar amino acid transport system substrate-binding protein
MPEDPKRRAANPAPRPSQGVTFIVASALILLAAVVLTAGIGSDAPLKPIFLATGEWAPYSGRSMPENGTASAIVGAVLRRAGYEPTFQFMPWERAEFAASENDANRGIRATFPYIATPERERAFYYSDPIIEIELSVFYNWERHPQGSAIRRFEDLAEFDVVTVSGYRYPAAVEALIDNTASADDNIAAFTQMIESDRPLVVIEASRVGEELLAGPLAARSAAIRAAPLRFTTPIHLIASRRNPNNLTLIRDFNAALAGMSESALEEIESATMAAIDLERMVILQPTDPSASIRAFVEAAGASSVLLPEGTRAVVERWSPAYLEPGNDSTEEAERLRVRVLNGPQRGKQLFVDPRTVVLP